MRCASPGAPVIVSPAPRLGPSAGVTKSCTLYVGKIAATVDNSVIKALLDACGTVKSWKRVEDTETGKPKPFGFCEYEDAEGVLMAMSNLNELALDGQELLLKPNSSTQSYIEDYKAKQAARQAEAADDTKKEGSQEEKSGAETAGRDENEVLEKIMAIVSEHSARSTVQHGGAAAAADKFLNGLRGEAGHSGQSGRSRKRAPGPPERDERRIEEDFMREKERERQADAKRRQELDRAYIDSEKSWERHERYAATPTTGCSRRMGLCHRAYTAVNMCVLSSCSITTKVLRPLWKHARCRQALRQAVGCPQRVCNIPGSHIV